MRQTSRTSKIHCGGELGRLDGVPVDVAAEVPAGSLEIDEELVVEHDPILLVQNGQSIRRQGGARPMFLCRANNLATASKPRAAVLVESASLPPAVTARLLADADAIAGRMARRIASEIRLPGHFNTVAYYRSIVSACRDALRVLVRRLHDGRGPRVGDLDRLAQIGADQADLDVPFDVLLSAYRVAAKVVWEEVVGTVAREHEMPPTTLIALAAQIIEYLDEISAAVGRRLPGAPRAPAEAARPGARPRPPPPPRRRRLGRAAGGRRRLRARPHPPVPGDRLRLAR